MDFCKCGSIEINGKCSNDHCPSKNLKHKDWVIDGRAVDFNKPVSCEEAEKFVRKLNQKDANT